MATNRRRFTISVNSRMEEEIKRFKEENGFATESGAIQELINLGIRRLELEQQRVKQEEKERNK